MRQVLTTTYFLYDGTFYNWSDGVAMRSPLAPVTANFYMEYFEQWALSSSKKKSSLVLICEQHFHFMASQEGRDPTIFTTPKQHSFQYQAGNGGCTEQVTPIFTHSGKQKTRWFIWTYNVQKTYMHRSIHPHETCTSPRTKKSSTNYTHPTREKHLQCW